MSKIILGIDPDSKAHGVAVFIDGKLHNLEMQTLPEVVATVNHFSKGGHSLVCAIENVPANTSTFRASRAGNKSVSAKMGHGIGRVHQATLELMRMLESMGVKYELYKISSKWKTQLEKKQFERLTGWEKSSNADTRSAAYFGYLEAKKK